MAISNTVIQIKKSGVTGNVPSSLGVGELALNYVDNKLFYKNASGGTSWFYGANNGPSFSTVSNGTSLITATAPNDTLTFATANGISITTNTSTKIITVGLTGITTTPTLNITGGIESTSVNTGSLIVTGGIGVSGNIYANGIYAVSALYANGISVSGGGGTSTFPTLNVTGNIPTTSNTTGSLVVAGGIGVSGNVYSTGSQSVFRGNVNIGNVVTGSNYPLDVTSSGSDTVVRSFTSAAGAWFMAYSTAGYYAGVKYVGANGARSWFSGMGNGNQAYTLSMSIDGASNRFFTIDTTGYISLAGAPGSESFRATPVANSVNYLQAQGASTGNFPGLYAQGSDSTVNIGYFAKGGGYHFFYGSNSAQLGILPTENAVNWLGLTGAANSAYPTISAQGSDANIGLIYDAKGSGLQYFRAQGNKVQFAIGATANAVNYMMAYGTAAGNYPVLTSVGADTNIGFVFNSKGSGAVAFQTNYLLQAQVSYTANAVNFLNFTGGATGAAPTISTLSYTDANVSMNISSQGFGVTNINSGSGQIAKFQDRGTTTVNSPYIFRAGLAGTAGGVLTFPVSPLLQTPDPSDFTFNTNAGTGGGQSGYTQVVIGHTAPTVNYLRLVGAAANNAPSISALGSDSNIDLRLVPKGTGTVLAGGSGVFSGAGFLVGSGASPHYIYSASANVLGFRVGTSPSYFQFTDNAGAIGLTTGNPFYFTGWAGTYTFAIAGPVNANAVNYLTVGTSVTGAGPTLYPNGSDANISLSLQPKGSGAINFVTGSKVNLGLGNSVSGIKIGNSGSGYTGFPTVVISASNAPSGGTTAVASAIGAMKVTNATVVAGGTGYAVNDVLTVVGGTTVTSAATLTVTAVSGNVITAVSSTNFGAYSVLPTSPVSTTSSSAGIGATFTLGYGIYSGTVALSNAGSGYVEQPSITFTGAGTPTIAATGFATVGSIPVINTIGSALSFNTPSGEQFRINDSNAPAVNYLQITGGASGISPSFAATGTDAAVGLSFTTKSTGNMQFNSNGFNNTMMLLQAIASSVNYLNIRPSITNSPVTLNANGSDANVGLSLIPKGTGSVIVTGPMTVANTVNAASQFAVSLQPNFNTNGTWANTAATFGGIAAGGSSAAGAVGIAFDTTTGGQLVSVAPGQGWYNMRYGANQHTFQNAGATHFNIISTASAVNYLQVTGGTTGNVTSISSLGSDTNVGLSIIPKGTGSVIVTGPMTVANTVNAASQFAVSLRPNFDPYVSSWANTAATFGGTGTAASAASVGIAFDSTNGGTLVSVSPGVAWYNMRYWALKHTFDTAGSTQFNIVSTSSAVNYLQVTGGAANNGPLISVQGSDTNISLALQSKGNGGIDFAAGANGVSISNGTSVTSLQITSIGSGYITVPTVTISAPTTTGGVTATANTASMGLWGIGVNFGGTGYSVNDVLTLVGGTVASSAVTLRVTTISANVITGITALNYGSYSVLPANPISVTGGTGTGANLSATWCVYGVNLLTGGSGYVEQPTVTFSAGGGAVAALAYATVGSSASVKGLGTQLNLQTANNQTSIQLLDDATMPIVNTALYVIGASSGLGRLALRSNKAFYISSGNGNPLGFFTNGSTTSDGSPQLNITHTASVNYLNITGGITNGAPVLSAVGSDANVSIFITPKGTGNVTVTSTTAATSPTAGALVVAGGIGVAGAVVHGAGTVSSPSVAIGASNRGFYNPTNGDVGFVAGGYEQVRYLTTSPAVNYLTMTGSNTAVAPIISVAGSDTNINVLISPKGTGLVALGGAAVANSSLQVVSVTNSVNYISVTGAVSGTWPTLAATGIDASVGMIHNTKGNGGHTFATSGATQAYVAHTASAVNYIQLTGSANAAAPVISAQGSDTDITLNISAKNNGSVNIYNGNGLAVRFYGGLNYLSLAGAGSGGATAMVAGGYDANINVLISPKGTGLVALGGSAVANSSLQVASVTNSVNYIKIDGGALGSGPQISAVGYDTNLSLGLFQKGTGGIYLGGSYTYPSVLISTPANTVNSFQMYGNSTGGGVSLNAIGADTNIGVSVSAKGTGGVVLAGNGQQIFAAINASGTDFTNYYNTTGHLNYTAAGGSTNINFAFTSKGTGAYIFTTGGGRQAHITDTASAVNYLQFTGAANTAAPTISAQGSDANITLKLQPKGTGITQFTSPLWIQRGYGGSSLIGLGGSTAYSIGTNASGIDNDTVIDATKTSSYTAYSTYPSTSAAAFNLQSLSHYSAQFFTLGAGSSITNQYGFRADGNLTVATNNYGFHSNLAAASGRYNFYAAGTADNVFAGQTSLGGLAGSESLRVTPVANSVNYVVLSGSTTNTSPAVGVAGADAGISLVFQSKGSGGFGFYTASGSVAQVGISHTASAVNYIQLTGSANAAAPVISTQGSDSNINLSLVAKGTGGIITSSNVAIGSTVLTIGKLFVSGGAIVGDQSIVSRISGGLANGSRGFRQSIDGTEYLALYDDNASAILQSGGTTRLAINHGTGVISLGAVAGSESLRVSPVDNSVNYVAVTGSANSAAPIISAQGSDSNINLKLLPKGTGYLYVGNIVNIGADYSIAATISAAGSTSSVVGTGVQGFYNAQSIDSTKTGGFNAFSSFISTAAAAFNVNTIAHYKAAFFTLGAGSSITNQYGFMADSGLTAATNNYGFYSGIAAASGRYNFYANGTADNVFVGQTSLGGYAGSEALRAVNTASAVNYIIATGAVTGATPKLTSSTVGIPVSIQGSHTWANFSNASAAIGVSTDITNAVGAHVILGSLNGNSPYIGSTNYSTSSNGGLSIQTNGVRQFLAAHTASAVNYIQVTGATTTGEPEISAQGSDVNISLKLTPKGTGNVRVTSTTTSTSNTTGALIVAGGLGVGGNTYLSNNLTIVSTNGYLNTFQYSQGYYSTLSYIGVTGTGSFAGVQYNATPATGGVSHSFTAYGSPTAPGQNLFLIGTAPQGGTSVNYLSVSSNTTGNAPVLSASGSDTNISIFISPKGTGNVTVNSTTAAISNTTGALVVSGGLGVSGNVYAGTIYASGAQLTTRPAVVVYSMIFGGS